MIVSLNTKIFNLFFLLFFIFCDFSIAEAAIIDVEIKQAHPNNSAVHYKDSYYFKYGGIKYLAVSSAYSNGSTGISLLKAYNNNDSDYRFFKKVIDGNHWAPTVIGMANGDLFFVTSEIYPAAAYTSKLKYFTFNIDSGDTSEVNNLNLSGGELGMIDAHIWFEPTQGTWYLVGSKWQQGAGHEGSRLQWARLESIDPIKFSFPVDLYRTANPIPSIEGGNVPWWQAARVDWWKYRSINTTENVVEAPIVHKTNNKLYWSIGPSHCVTGKTTGIRHGSINWNGATPWIAVDDDLYVADNPYVQCNLLTHPDFTDNGEIRATSQLNGGRFLIVNQK